MDTEAELEKLTRTMTAFQKPIPPPRQVFLRKLTELSCKSGIHQERGPKGPDFKRVPFNYPWA